MSKYLAPSQYQTLCDILPDGEHPAINVLKALRKSGVHQFYLKSALKKGVYTKYHDDDVSRMIKETITFAPNGNKYKVNHDFESSM